MPVPLKIAVYTIALNEAKHVERWASSVAEADHRVVVDTGSTDGTPERLAEAGVAVHRIAIRPWRFDDARNAALALLPGDVDVCISLDMDNFMQPGWRAALEAAWTPEATRLKHKLQINLKADGTPAVVFDSERIHARWHYRWSRPVHEHLVCVGRPEVEVRSDAVVMSEIQDAAKDTRRHYLPLLALAAEESPGDSQICFWHGRELVWDRDMPRAAEVLRRFLALPTSTWGPERSEAMMLLAQAEPDRRGEWLEKAMLETPYRREVWLELAEYHHARSDWLNLYWACASGIEKGRRTGSYLDRPHAWGARLHDLGALACWRLRLGSQSLAWSEEAMRLAPQDQRLQNNHAIYTRDASA